MVYHAVDELVVVVAVDDGGAFPRHVLLVDHRDVAEEQVRRVPREQVYPRIQHFLSISYL